MPINGRLPTPHKVRCRPVAPTISLEDDPTPMVRILGVTLRRAAASPALAQTIDGMHGRVALKSTKDPQAATITFDKGSVRIAHGAAPDADITIAADLDTMGQPGAAKPKVKGAVAHPKFALAVSKVLDAPVDGGWRGAAREFWQWSEGRPGRPAAMRIVCTDESSELLLGDGQPTFEVHGPAWALAAVLTGADHVGAAAIAGRVQAVGDFPTMNRLIGLLTKRMLGDD